MNPPDSAQILAGTVATHHPAANDAERALLEWAAAHPIERPRLSMDAKEERYRAHVPGGDKERSYTRVTTFADALDDSAGLTIWRHRLLAAGMAQIADELAACTDDRERDRVIAKALHIAGEKLKADLGTAIHTAMEHAVMGTGEVPPAPYHLDVAAALTAMRGAGIEPVAELCESQLWNPDFEVIGTADVLAAGPWVGGRLRIADYKTGSRIERNGYAIQQALYATATHRWTAEGWTEVPPIDQAVGYIIHTPIGTGTCTIYEVDLAAGIGRAGIAAHVRDLRRDKSVRACFTKAHEASATTAATEPPAVAGTEGGAAAPASPSTIDATEWLIGRIRAVAAASTDAKSTLARRWPDGTPTTPPWSDDQSHAIAEVLTSLEVACRIEPPFPPLGSIFAPISVEETPGAASVGKEPTPPGMWDIIDEPGPVDLDHADAITAAFATLPDERKSLAAVWARDAKTGSRPWAVGRDDLTPRLLAIYGAVLSSLRNLWDGDGAPDCEITTRAALSIAIGEDVQPGWRTGAVLGALTIDQARRLDELAVAFGIDDHTAAEVGAKVLALTAA